MYLRDLNQEQQNSWKKQFQKDKRTDILKAIEKGQDIHIGEYFPVKDCKVVR